MSMSRDLGVSVLSGALVAGGECLVEGDHAMAAGKAGLVQFVSSFVALEVLPMTGVTLGDAQMDCLLESAVTALLFAGAEKYIMKKEHLVKSFILSFVAEWVSLYGYDSLMKVWDSAVPATGKRSISTGDVPRSAVVNAVDSVGNGQTIAGN